jgi:hypothetical protein
VRALVLKSAQFAMSFNLRTTLWFQALIVVATAFPIALCRICLARLPF